MLIRNFNKNDILKINELGNLLHNNFKFELDEFSNCLVIESDNGVVGFIIYSIIYERSEIVDIIIDPKSRKKGYGLKLINEAIGIISLNGCDNITLEVNENNLSAIKLYKKSGFKICAERKNYYKTQNGLLMIKELR